MSLRLWLGCLAFMSLTAGAQAQTYYYYPQTAPQSYYYVSTPYQGQTVWYTYPTQYYQTAYTTPAYQTTYAPRYYQTAYYDSSVQAASYTQPTQAAGDRAGHSDGRGEDGHRRSPSQQRPRQVIRMGSSTG